MRQLLKHPILKHPLVYIAFVLLIAIVAVIPIAAFASNPTFKEWSLPVTTAHPENITPGFDGKLWFAQVSNNNVSEIDPNTGSISNYVMQHTATGSEWSMPLAVARGPDNNMWFSEVTVPQLGKMHSDGTYTLYPMSNTQVSLPDSMVAGPGGNLWFTSFENSYIGVMSTGGTLLHLYPTSGNPEGISVGPDGNIWYAEQTANAVGKMNPNTGSVTTYSVPFVPFYTAAGPDGDEWIGGESNTVLKMNPNTGATTSYNFPSGGAYVPSITAGPDGNMWFSLPYYPGFGMVNLSTGAVQEFTAPSNVWSIAFGPDKNLWYTVFNKGKIGVAYLGLPGSTVPGTGSTSSGSSGSGSSGSGDNTQGDDNNDQGSNSQGQNNNSQGQNSGNQTSKSAGNNQNSQGAQNAPSTSSLSYTGLSNKSDDPKLVVQAASSGVTNVTVAKGVNLDSDDYNAPANQVLFVDGSLGKAYINKGATIKGSGKLDDIVVYKGAYVAPGHSPGCMTTNDFTLYGSYNAQIGGTTACTGYDQVIAKNSITLSGTLNVSFVNNFKPKTGQTFTVIKNEGKSPVSGTFADLAEGSTFVVNDTPFSITYKGGSGHDVVIKALNKDAYLLALSAKNTAHTQSSGSFSSFVKRNDTAILSALIAAFVIVVAAIYYVLKTHNNYKKPGDSNTVSPAPPTVPSQTAPPALPTQPAPPAVQ